LASTGKVTPSIENKSVPERAYKNSSIGVLGRPMCHASSGELYYKLPLSSEALLLYFFCMHRVHVLPPMTPVKSRLSTRRRLTDILFGYYPTVKLA